MAFSQDQFNALLGAVAGNRTGKRAREFSSGTSQDWVSWRATFMSLAQLNQWDNERARLEIHTSITGPAHVLVGHIPSGVPEGGAAAGHNIAAYRDLLNEYEAFFLPVAASSVARTEAKTASQEEGETILHWHGRIRTLYQRANPNLTANQLNTDHNLIAMFIDGLIDTETVRFTLQTILRTTPWR